MFVGECSRSPPKDGCCQDAGAMLAQVLDHVLQGIGCCTLGAVHTCSEELGTVMMLLRLWPGAGPHAPSDVSGYLQGTSSF